MRNVAGKSRFWPCSYGQGAGPVERLFYRTHMEEGGDGGCNVVTTEGSEPKEIRISCSFLNRICGRDHTHDILYLYLHIDISNGLALLATLDSFYTVISWSWRAFACLFFKHTRCSYLHSTFPEEHAPWMAPLSLSYLFIPPPLPPPPADKEVNGHAVLTSSFSYTWKLWLWPFLLRRTVVKIPIISSPADNSHNRASHLRCAWGQRFHSRHTPRGAGDEGDKLCLREKGL